MALLKYTSHVLADLQHILIAIYCFVDDFLKQLLENIRFAIERPRQGRPPQKTFNLSVAELVTLALFKSFTGHSNWKDFYQHIMSYHGNDFPNLPNYQNFLAAMNKLSSAAYLMLSAFMQLFRAHTKDTDFKFPDSTKLKVCENKRIFGHKTNKAYAKRGKSSMGWFYGFKLHIVVNELMQILGVALTPGNTDDRKGLDMIWDELFGVLIADAGYIGKKWEEKARNTGKVLFTAVKANMKKLMTEAEHAMLKLRQRVETVFSVLKLRMYIESTLPRSPRGMFAHYVWCLTAYQFKKFVEYCTTPSLLGISA